MCLCGCLHQTAGKIEWEDEEVDAGLRPGLLFPLTVSATFAADDKHLHSLTKEICFSTSCLPCSLIYYSKEITLTCLRAPPYPLLPLFVHRFVYYSLYGKSFRNVEEVGVSSRSLSFFNGVGWRRTRDVGRMGGSCSNIPQYFRWPDRQAGGCVCVASGYLREQGLFFIVPLVALIKGPIS